MDLREYFRMLDEQVAKQYEIAGKARAKGLDPSPEVEAVPTRNLAERVEGLVGPKYIGDEIKKAQEERLPREKIVERIIDWILKGTYLKDQSKEQRIEQALRTALAILTEGVVSAPLEGISHVSIEKNPDGSDYLAVYFAGPIRGAGGTAAALSVLLGDYIRRKVGVSDYRPTDTEVERYKEEIKIYHKRVVRLQYMPTDEEIELIMRNVPVCIDGDPTEKQEVDIYKGLERIKTDRIRGGICLVIGEGIAQKHKKVLKFAEAIGLEGWEWLKDMKKGSEDDKPKKGAEEIRPNRKFLDDIVAGRPIFAYPSRPGGFRLRYGRSNMCGIASKAIHPAAMELLEEFPVVGTQMRVERPGKGMIAVPCAQMEPPVIKDSSGGVRPVSTVKEAREARRDAVEILSLGDMLIPFGDFLNSNETLPPSGYVEEWWEQEYEKKAGEGPPRNVNGARAVGLSSKTGVPLHPKYTPPWHDVTAAHLRSLVEWVKKSLTSWDVKKNLLVLKNDNREAKRTLELLLVPHRVSGESVEISDYALPLLTCLGLAREGELKAKEPEALKEAEDGENALSIIQRVSPVKIRRKVGCYIGARMGRPEKAKERKMVPAVHALFPVGSAGGNIRSVNKAAANTFVRTEVARMRCPECNKLTFLSKCPDCGKRTAPEYKCSCGYVGDRKVCPKCKRETLAYEEREVPVKGLMELAGKRVKRKRSNGDIKGVRGMTSAMKLPELLEKGILRSNNGVYVFKDGTIRYDGTDIPSTHFRPTDIGVPVERVKQLGYEKDIEGKPLERADQIVSLLPQDIIVPRQSARYLTGMCNFTDDLLSQVYGMEPCYGVKKKSDLVGKLVVGLAPHTSAAILGRIIGFADVKGIIAHPFWHSAKRRNCLAPSTEILILNSNKPKLATLENLFERASESEVVDDFGTVKRSVDGLSTWSLNPITGNFEKKRIKSVLRVPSPRHLVQVRTKSGRKFTASPEHRLFVNSGDGPSFKKISELGGGDALMSPRRLDFSECDCPEIDLLREMPAGLHDILMLRGIRTFVEGLVGESGGLTKAAKALGLGKKTFSNYLYRDSIPLGILESLLRLSGKSLDDIPDCRLAIKRDSTEIKRRIKLDEHFMRLVGYYLAEGHSRMSKKSFYQISFACAEEEMSEDIAGCVRRAFGLAPGRNDVAVTISNRIAYHLFTDVLKLGSNAREKRIDSRFLSLPKGRVRELLRAYFSGDGSVEKGRLHVTCSSVSEGLLRDIGFLLLRFGIFYRIKEERRAAAGLARDFYLMKKREVPKFRLCYISIRSKYAKLFHDEIGFALRRKQKALTTVLSKEGSPRIRNSETLFMDPIISVNPIKKEIPFLYDIEVEDNHTFLMNDFLVSANCDGDEDSLMLLMDVLLNFSYAYLPESRGGRMDAPLVVNTNLDPGEIDDEAHCMEVGDSYPLEFYELTQTLPSAKEAGIDVVGNHLEDDPFRMGLTKFSTWKGAPSNSRYVQLKTMSEKTAVELELCKRIRAVDVADVAKRLVDSHLIRDTYGNLRAFARQKFRCVKCNKKYRRVPLLGKCEKCGGRVILTVSRGTIEKYVALTGEVVGGYVESDYIKQRMELVQKEIESVFENDKVKQFSLSDFA